MFTFTFQFLKHNLYYTIIYTISILRFIAYADTCNVKWNGMNKNVNPYEIRSK